ncbi:MAG TPA: DUF397 domain-containing protein [Propionibacteriaceae bacterium]
MTHANETSGHPVIWRKSSHSGDTGDCVELAPFSSGQIAIRDSKDPAHQALVFSSAQFADFIRRVRSDEL